MKKFLRLLGSILLALTVSASGSIAQEGKYPLDVSVKFEDGSALLELENRLINAINEIGYAVESDAFILVEGLLSVSSEKVIPGVSPKTMVNLNLDIKIKDSEKGDVFKSLSITGQGLGSNMEESIRKGIEKVEIDTVKLSQTLADCYDDYLRIKERRARLSKERFEEGERLFRKERYREALAKLKGVYPESEYFPKAQQLMQDIRLIMPKPAIAVLKFKTNSSDIADSFRDILTAKLVQMLPEEITVLEREQMSEILGEQSLELDGLVDTARASEFGRLIGADFMFLGRLTVSGDNIELDGRLVRVGTAEIIIASHTNIPKNGLEVFTKNILDELRNAIEDGKLDKKVEITTPADDELKKTILEKKLRVMIMIPEVHIHRPVPDPAGETEMIRKFVKSGFRVVDQTQVKKIRDTREGKSAVKGDNQSAVAIARQYSAQVIIVGEAFSENIPRPGDARQTCGARIEVRAIDSDTGMILAATGKEAHATDATEGVAAKRALRTAGGLLADDMIKQIVESWKGRGELYEIELLVKNIEYDQLVQLESFLKEKGMDDVQRRSFDEGVSIIDIQSKESAQNLADALAIAKLNGFNIKIETVTANTIEATIEKKQ